MGFGVSASPKSIDGRVRYRGDYIGERFGNLVVIAYKTRDEFGLVRMAGVVCRCDCGNTEEFSSYGELLRGKYQMCCECRKKMSIKRKKEWSAQNHKPDPKNAYKHERLYAVWYGMKTRCENEKSQSYKYYGAKGVRVCDEWQDYFAFRDWANSHGYRPDAPRGDCTIDRINPFGNYEPSNCRFVDMDTQRRNKRRNWSHQAADLVSSVPGTTE